MLAILIAFIAQVAAYVFLGLTWATRGQRNVGWMFFSKTGYFVLNPLFRPAGLRAAGRRYRWGAIFCFGVMIVAIGTLPYLASHSLTHTPS